MGIVRLLLPALLVVGVLSGCGDVKTADGDSGGIDTINITKISPLSATAGVETEFTVEVEYNLVSDTDGVLDIGFNTDAVDAFLVKEIYGKSVTQGSGTATFTVKVTPTDWAPEFFQVQVYLSEDPKPSSWVPYASDIGIIEVAATALKPSQDKSAAPLPAASPVTCYTAAGVDDFCVRYE